MNSRPAARPPISAAAVMGKTSLTFKVMVRPFTQGVLECLPLTSFDVYLDGQFDRTWPFEKCCLEFKVKTWAVSWGILDLPGWLDQPLVFRFEFQEGRPKIFDESHGDNPVACYDQGDGTYFIEYWLPPVYICNQNQPCGSGLVIGNLHR